MIEQATKHNQGLDGQQALKDPTPEASPLLTMTYLTWSPFN